MATFLRVVTILLLSFNGMGAEASAVAMRGTHAQPMSLHIEVCQFCYRQCPVSCYAGTCSLNSAIGVKRFQKSSHCWSCDPAASTLNGGPLQYCTPQQAGATIGFQRVTIDGSPTTGEIGANPDFLGSQHASAASDAIGKAVSALEHAAAQAGIAGGNPSGLDGLAAASAANASAIAAGAVNATDATAATSVGASQANADAMGDITRSIEVADSHQLASQIRAAQALRTSQMAHAAWQMALNQYNWQLQQLRMQQIRIDQAEDVVERAEQAANIARKSWASAANQAAIATQAAMLSGDGAAGAEQAAAARMERETTYRAAQRRLLIAAGEAKKASDLAGSVQARVTPTAGGQWIEIQSKDSYPGCQMPMQTPDVATCKAKALNMGYSGFTWYTGQCCQGTCCFKDQTAAELMTGVTDDCSKTLWVYSSAPLSDAQRISMAPSVSCPHCEWTNAAIMPNKGCANVLWDAQGITIAEARVRCENDVACLGLVWHNTDGANANFIAQGHFKGCGGAIGANDLPMWDIIVKPGTCQTAAAASASLLSQSTRTSARGPLRGAPAALVVQEAAPTAAAPAQAAPMVPPLQDPSPMTAALDMPAAPGADRVPSSFDTGFVAASAEAPGDASPDDPGAALPQLPAFPADPSALADASSMSLAMPQAMPQMPVLTGLPSEPALAPLPLESLAPGISTLQVESATTDARAATRQSARPGRGKPPQTQLRMT